MDLEYYKAIQGGVNAQSDRDIIEREAKDALSRELVSSIAYEDDVYVNNNKQPLIITQTKDMYIYNIESMPNETFELGDEVIWQQKHWLVTGKYRGTKYQDLGSIEKCNFKLRWQDFDKMTYECWCIVGDEYSRYNRDNITINSAVDTLTLTMPACECVKKLYLGKRIALGTHYNQQGEKILLVYKVAIHRNITLDYDGDKLIRMMLARDVYNPETDNLEEMICDYQPFDSIKCATGGMSEILGKSVYRISGNPRTYSAVFTRANGDADEAVNPVWTVDIPDEYADAITYEIDDEVLCVSVENDTKIIGATISISVQDENGLYPLVSKTVEVTA